MLKAVAEQLRMQAARQRMSLRDLAARSGVPYPTVRKSLSGERMIDVEELFKLTAALGVKPHILMAAAEAAVEENQLHAEWNDSSDAHQRQLAAEAAELGITMAEYAELAFDFEGAKAKLAQEDFELAARDEDREKRRLGDD